MKHKKWVIYFVLANGLVKIGTTSDYDRRIKALKAANASFIEELGVIEGGNDLEKSIHQRFRHCHSHAEWFFATQDLLAFIGDEAVPYQAGMGKVLFDGDNVVYAGLTMRQMRLAGMLVAPKTESVYQRQVRLTVLRALRQLIDANQPDESFCDENLGHQVIIDESGIIPLDEEQIVRLFLAISVGMIQLKFVPKENPRFLGNIYRWSPTMTPEVSIDLKKEYDTRWFQLSSHIFSELTQEWRLRGVEDDSDIAILTDELTQATFDLTLAEYKKLKQLGQYSLFDHMTGIELAFATLGEVATLEVTRQADTWGFDENLGSARKGGRIAGNARRELEAETGRPVVSPTNYLERPQAEQERLDSGEDKDKGLS
jgi:hypothetical protein